MSYTRKISTDNIQTRILVVDDEAGIRELLDDFLSMEFNVSTASSANEALVLLERNEFDIALVDINMPEMSGREFFKECRKKYQKMQIILMTGRPELADAISTVKEGTFYYLIKPVELKLLNSLVLKAVQEKKEGNAPGSCDAGIIKNLGLQYKIIRSLGCGASGVVLLVENNRGLYAMKLLRHDNPENNLPDQTERFAREADILMRIENEHVVRIVEHNLGRTDEHPYIIIEYVKGMSLSGCINEGKLDINQKISIIRQIAEALDCLHGHGVIHRDIKPDNILLTDGLFVKITDFGICHVQDSSLTISHQILGSPQYMAPESFDAGRKPDQKVDMFSLGVLSYELLTGTRPFEEKTICRVVKALKYKKPAAPVKLNPEIPVWMQNIMAKMLDKNPDRRFGSCGEISEAINYYLAGGRGKTLSFALRIFGTMFRCNPVWS